MWIKWALVTTPDRFSQHLEESMTDARKVSLCGHLLISFVSDWIYFVIGRLRDGVLMASFTPPVFLICFL